MEITQKLKVERFAYSTTINGEEATCTIMVRDGVRRGATADLGGINIRKPDDVLMVNISCEKDSMPEDVNGTLASLEAFLDECIALHTTDESVEVAEEATEA